MGKRVRITGVHPRAPLWQEGPATSTQTRISRRSTTDTKGTRGEPQRGLGLLALTRARAFLSPDLHGVASAPPSDSTLTPQRAFFWVVSLWQGTGSFPLKGPAAPPPAPLTHWALPALAEEAELICHHELHIGLTP